LGKISHFVRDDKFFSGCHSDYGRFIRNHYQTLDHVSSKSFFPHDEVELDASAVGHGRVQVHVVVRTSGVQMFSLSSGASMGILCSVALTSIIFMTYLD
jgi:hypothetical protein